MDKHWELHLLNPRNLQEGVHCHREGHRARQLNSEQDWSSASFPLCLRLTDLSVVVVRGIREKDIDQTWS
jgi:hypothetical protein